MIQKNLLVEIGKFTCPLCKERLVKGTKNNDKVFYCETDNCSFYTPVNDRGEPKLLSSATETVMESLQYLANKHNKHLCGICDGGNDPKTFENSLFHQLLERGRLTKSQRNEISTHIDRVKNATNINKRYKFPLDESVTKRDLIYLEKFDML